MVRRSHLTCSPKAKFIWLSMFVFNTIMCVGLSFASQNVPALSNDSLNEIQSYDVVFDNATSVDTKVLAAIGCQPRFIRGERAEIRANSNSIAKLSKMASVLSIAPTSDIIPCQGTGTVISEAVQFTGALSMQTNGITGRGAKIAIIDLGFSGLSATEVPVSLADSSRVISFRSDRSVTASTHGAAVAEQVADMAPDSEYSLLAVDTSMSIEAAIDFVISRDFTVAIMALNIVDGPFDGTHPVSKAVDRAAKNGVFWVQAAGNFAQRHWAGIYKDSNSNTKHEFAKSTEYMSLSITTASHLNVYLSWFETAGATTNRDYDLVLRDSAGGFVAQSGISQTGTTPPKEKLSVDLAIGTYRLEIIKASKHTDVNEKFKLFIDNPTALVPTALRIPASSLGIPAEASGAFTVGATRGTTVDVTPYGLRAMSVDFIEDFSSQGPTLSGAIKPNLVAPDACRTSLAAVGTAVKDAVYHDFVGANAFGTSFAAAHVAGAAALLWSEDNTRTNTSLATALVNMSMKKFPEPPAGQVDPGDPPNNVYGYGRLALRIGVDVTQPVINIIYPRNGDTITSTTPEIKVEISDAGSGVNAATIKLILDDIEYAVVDEYDETTGLLVFRVPEPLANGSHRLSITCADNSGNIATPVVSSFRLASLTIGAGLRMISIPYSFIDMDASEIRPATIFGLQPDEINIARWLATDSTPGNKYHVFGGPDNIEDEYASFVPLDSQEPPFVVSQPPAGLGYFINLPKVATVNIGRANVLSDLIEYNVKLSYGYSQPRGWNMIGCPFPEATSWSTVQFITNGVRQDLRDAISSGVTEGILFELKNVGGTVYYDFPSDPLSSSLQPWKGYWVHVLKDTTLVMYNGAVTEAAVTRDSASTQSVNNDGWTLKFGASTAGGLDPANYIGVRSAATTGYDAGLDVPKPPALNTPVRIAVVNDDWSVNSGEYARDIQPLADVKSSWNVNVTCSIPNSVVTLAWSEINECVPAGVSLSLKDTVTGKTVPMRSVSSYAFQCGDSAETRSFIITAENKTSSALVINNITTSQLDAGRVSFAYSVSADADVTAEILSIAGRPIASIAPSDAQAGEVSVVSWNGLNSAGSRAPAGRYMLRLSARSVDGTMAQAVRAFSLSR